MHRIVSIGAAQGHAGIGAECGQRGIDDTLLAMTKWLLAFGIAAAVAFCQAPGNGTAAPKGTVQRIKVHGKALEGNLAGDPADRDVSVYLPASYAAGARRYPVIYMLHGYTDSDEQWMGFKKHWINLAEVIDRAMAKGDLRETIVVMPNAYTRYQGSMYSNSATTGNWEDYVAQELVAYVDAHYRTVAAVGSRGLAGHSMGGYGAARIGMRHPDVFSSVYLLSPCCMASRAQLELTMPAAEAIQTQEQFEKADFGTKAAIASAVAWSPNPKNPPLFFDLPYKGGEYQPQVAAKWAANAPLAMIDQYIANIRRLKALGMDAGTEDRVIAATVRTLDRVLTDYGIAHEFEIYEGDHLNHVADRIATKMLPFFTKNLK
jgi:S-formylglutathione hydrolase FrmB